MKSRIKGRNICNYYSYSQGKCFPTEFVDSKSCIVNVDKCPVIKKGKACDDYVYHGDTYGAIDE